jgi:TonB family protein
LVIPLRTSIRLLFVGCLALCVAPARAQSAHRAVVTRVAPIYPELARRMHVGGKVVLLVTIQPNGTVAATKVESGHALLTVAAEDAVRRWRFSPDSDTSETEVQIDFTPSGQ